MDCADCSCPLFTWLEIFERKWNLRIVRELYKGNKGFNEIKRAIPGITQGVLSQRLDELEANKIIMRKLIKNKPMNVEYVLTTNVRNALSCWQPMQELKVKC